MSLNFLELKPKHQPKEFTLNIYPNDFEKLSKFVEFINRNKTQEEVVAPEDIFEELMKATEQVVGFNEFLASNKGAKRGRKRISPEQ